MDRKNKQKTGKPIKPRSEQQECIPIGCVPPARYCTRGVSVQGHLCPGAVCPGREGVCPGGVSVRETPPVERILDTHLWKHYLAATSLRAVISNLHKASNNHTHTNRSPVPDLWWQTINTGLESIRFSTQQCDSWSHTFAFHHSEKYVEIGGWCNGLPANLASLYLWFVTKSVCTLSTALFSSSNEGSLGAPFAELLYAIKCPSKYFTIT